MIEEAQIRKIIQQEAGKIHRFYQDIGAETVKAIIVLTGAFMYASDLLRALAVLNGHGGRRIRWKVDSISIGSYGKKTTSSGEVKVYKDLQTPVLDQYVLVVEDIVDTGQSAQWLLDRVRLGNPRSVEIATFLRKPSRAVIEVSPRFVGAEIDDHFVVGYGLDYADEYRELPDLCVLEIGAEV